MQRPNPFLPEKKPGINYPGSCEKFLHWDMDTILMLTQGTIRQASISNVFIPRAPWHELLRRVERTGVRMSLGLPRRESERRPRQSLSPQRRPGGEAG